MSSEVLVFQEFVEVEKSSNFPSVRSNDISKVFYFGETNLGNKLKSEFTSQQIKPITWQSFVFTSSEQPNHSIPFAPSKGNDWSIISLPRYSSVSGKIEQ